MVIRRDIIDGFMCADITEETSWLKLDGSSGIVYALFEDVPAKNRLFDFADFYAGSLEDHEMVKGYGARLSAPGYLDCTSWAVFDTEQEAIDYLKKNFDDEEEVKPEE